MWKAKDTNIISVMNELKRLLLNITTLFTLVLLLKLLYFNSQIGNGSLDGFNGLAALGSLLILASISCLMKPKMELVYIGLLNLLLTLMIFSNILFYRYFNDMISIPLLTQASVVSDVGSSMFQLMHFSDLLLIIDFILLPLLWKNSYRFEFTRIKGRQALVCMAVGTLLMVLSFNQLIKSQPTILQTFYDRVYVAQNVGLLNYHAADAFAFVQQSIAEDDQLDAKKQQEIFEYFRKQKQSESSGENLFGAAKGKNLIVIQIEALQQFVVNTSINGVEVTPNLNKLAASGIYFNNYYYQTAGGGTSDAEFTANISMFPMKVGAAYIRKSGNQYYALPRKMKEAGYSTVAMHGYKPGFWNRSVVYKNIGFDEFYSKSNLVENEALGMGISDKDFFKQAVEKLKQQKQPYYAFLITLSSHFPYDNDKSKYSSFDVGKYKDTLLGDYLEAVHYTDEALGHFLEELQRTDLSEQTVVAVYGDHHGIPKDNQEELAEFLGKEELSSLEWQQLQKVPMIISAPGINSMTINTVGGGVDFMPTLQNIMGIDGSSQPSFGRDLVNSNNGLVILRNGSFVTNDKMYISGENICYDLETGKEVPMKDYAEIKQQADQQLNYSDIILKYDLVDEIKAYLEK